MTAVNWCLIVDQFEELFTLVDDECRAPAFPGPTYTPPATDKSQPLAHYRHFAGRLL